MTDRATPDRAAAPVPLAERLADLRERMLAGEGFHDDYDRACADLRDLGELPTLLAALDGREAGWLPIGSAPRDGTPFLAWCPVVPGLGDGECTPDGEHRVVWWETRGQFTSDRDLGNETFTAWRPLPDPPARPQPAGEAT